MKPLALDGIVDVKAEPSEGMSHEWRREKQRLEEEILSLRRELDDARTHNEKLERAMRALRQSLSPLHRALRSVFGEIELAVGEEDRSAPIASGTQPPQSASEPRWESFKQTFPGMAARIIDALLAHQQMSYGQLKTLLRADYNTVKNAAAKLQKAGAIVKEGTMCRLNR